MAFAAVIATADHDLLGVAVDREDRGPVGLCVGHRVTQRGDVHALFFDLGHASAAENEEVRAVCADEVPGCVDD